MAEHYLQNYINIANNNLEMAYKLLDKEEALKAPKRGMAAFFSHIITGR